MSIHPNSRMATEIDRYEAIAQLEQINGVPTGEIEERARPGHYARSGFIGPTEALKDVLQRDWKTVKALGTTHVELAAHLREIWKRVEASNEETCRFSYSVNQLPRHSLRQYEASSPEKESLSRKMFFALGWIAGVGVIIAAFTISPLSLLFLFPLVGCICTSQKNKSVQSGQNLRGRIDRHKGIQEDLFGRDKRQARMHGWNDQLEIANSSNRLSVLVGRGTIDYIEKYGFYEGGGERNPYRVDPLKLVAILTGAPISALQSSS